MKQGRKSRYRTVAALRCALTVLAAIAAIAPATALGQAAAGEYDQAKLPQANDEKYQLPSGDDQSAGAAVVPSNGDGGPGAGSSSGGGSATVLLIALAAVAAGSVGVAAWRLRRGGSGADGSGESQPPITQGSTGESRTL